MLHSSRRRSGPCLLPRKNQLRPDVAVTVILAPGSNLLVRDGGIKGVVIRLGRGFGEITIEDGHEFRSGTAVPDVKVARAVADDGISEL